MKIGAVSSSSALSPCPHLRCVACLALRISCMYAYEYVRVQILSLSPPKPTSPPPCLSESQSMLIISCALYASPHRYMASHIMYVCT